MRWIYLFLSLLFFNAVHAQNLLLPFKESGKWGFINENGEWLIEANYDAVGDFGRNQFSSFQKNGKAGLISREGKELIIPKAQKIDLISDSVLSVLIGQDWFLYSLKDGLIDTHRGSKIIALNKSMILLQKPDFWVLYNAESKAFFKEKIISYTVHENNVISLREAENGLLLFRNSQLIFRGPAACSYLTGGNWAPLIQIDSNKHRLILYGVQPKIIRGVLNLNKLGIGSFIIERKDHPWLYLNTAKDLKLEIPKLDFISKIDGNFFLISKDFQYGLMDRKARIVLPCSFDAISFMDNLIRVRRGGQFGLTDFSGKEVLPVEYHSIERYKYNSLLLRKNNLFGLASPFGFKLLPAVFESLEVSPTLLKARFDNVFHLYELGDWKIIESQRFVNVKTIRLAAMPEKAEKPKFELGWFYGKRAGAWGFRRADSSYRHNPQFNSIKHFDSTGLTIVSKFVLPSAVPERLLDDMYRPAVRTGVCFTSDGNYLLSPKLWYIHSQEPARKDVNYLRGLSLNGKYVVYYKSGLKLKKDFTWVDSLNEGMARFNINGKWQVDENHKHRRNLCSQPDFKRSIGQAISASDWGIQNDFVRINYGSWGFLDIEGRIAIEARYDYVFPFEQGKARVIYDNKWGVIDKKGNYIIKPIYDWIELKKVENRSCFLVFKRKKRFGALDTSGIVQLDPVLLQARPFTNGFAAVKFKSGWTFLKGDMRPLHEAVFDEVEDFNACSEYTRVAKDRKWGFLGKSGVLIVDCQYRKLSKMRNERAFARKSNGWILIDQRGIQVHKRHFRDVCAFASGRAFVLYKRARKWRLIDRQGLRVNRKLYHEIHPFQSNGRAFIRDDQGWWMIDTNGQILTDSALLTPVTFTNGLAWAKTVDGYHLLFQDGRMKKLPVEAFEVNSFKEGKARILTENGLTFIDTNTQPLFPLYFTQARDFSDGYAYVQQRGESYIIDSTGFKIQIQGRIISDFVNGKALIVDPNDSVRFNFVNTSGEKLYSHEFEKLQSFANSRSVVRINGKWTMMTEDGILIDLPHYGKIKTPTEGISFYKRNGQYGLFNLEGIPLINCVYDDFSWMEDGLARVFINNRMGYFNLNKGWIKRP